MKVEDVVRILCLGREIDFFFPTAADGENRFEISGLLSCPVVSGEGSPSSGVSLLDKLLPSCPLSFLDSLLPPSSCANPGVTCLAPGNRTVIVESLARWAGGVV